MLWQDTVDNIKNSNLKKHRTFKKMVLVQEFESFAYPKEEIDFLDVAAFVVWKSRRTATTDYMMQDLLVNLSASSPLTDKTGVPFYLVLKKDFFPIKEIEEYISKLRRTDTQLYAALYACGIVLTEKLMHTKIKDYDRKTRMLANKYILPEWVDKIAQREIDIKLKKGYTENDFLLASSSEKRLPMKKNDLRSHMMKLDTKLRTDIGEKILQRPYEKYYPPNSLVRYCMRDRLRYD